MKNNLFTRAISLGIAISLVTTATISAKELLPYQDPQNSIEERVEDLIGRMTLEEKVAQVCAMSLRDSVATEEGTSGKVKAVRDGIKNGIGQIENTFDPRTAKQAVIDVNALQRYLMEETRLGIPALVGSECLHGHAGYNSTVIPVPLALASSWNTDLVQESFLMVGNEARARGAHEAHTPVLDLGRDPRWGRIEETFGEDTYLVSEMGRAVTSGLQGGTSGVPGVNSIISSPKHFAGYGQVAGGRNFAATEIDHKTLFDDVLPPFEIAVKEVKVQGMMASHCGVGGVPAHGNHWLLTELLRDEWGFPGYVVSDYNDVPRLSFFQNVVETVEDAAGLGIYAGVDMDLPVGEAYGKLKGVIEANPELESSLDNSVRRVLRLKFLMGLFENPYADEVKAEQSVGSEKHVDLALKMATESVVLLKNENRLLPLNDEALKRIAVIGPNADSKAIGNYTVKNDHVVSILEGIQNYLGNRVEVDYAEGCSIPKLGWENKQTVMVEVPLQKEEAEIAAAVKIAKQADVAIVCVGGTTETSREAFFVDGIKGDRSTLGLLGNQRELVLRIAETGTPVVVILMGGRPFSIPEVSTHADAILNTFYLGQTNGVAIAKLLFGDVNPSGKLPVTVPRSVGQLPAYYSQKKISFYKDYLDEAPGPLYPFGYGLSYTSFAYSGLEVEKESFAINETIRVKLTVENTGTVAGAEVVQLYFRDCVATITRPEKKLVRFAKVFLEPGEKKVVEFELDPMKDLAFTGMNLTKVVEPGTFKLMAGGSSVDANEIVAFTLR